MKKATGRRLDGSASKKALVKATARTSVSPVGGKSRAIAALEPVAKKVKRGKTAKPLAPERVAAILDGLEKAYPKALCALNHRSAWELLVATILSAQCTDVRVNLVTPDLFKAFPTPKSMAAASLPELEELVRTTGFFRNKAKSIKGCCGFQERRGRRRMWCWDRGIASLLAWWWTRMCCGFRGDWS
jgi:endonuclease-3